MTDAARSVVRHPVTRVAIRADASVAIGTGHVMRCLTLAHALRRAGAEAEFVCRTLEGDMIDQVVLEGFAVHRLPPTSATGVADAARTSTEAWLGVEWETDARETIDALGDQPLDLLVSDHYGIDARWEGALRPRVSSLLVIDDLADRPHDCDVLLDQNYSLDAKHYHGLVPEACITLIGPRFALLREEFRTARVRLRARAGACDRIVVFFGGIDASNASALGLAAIARSRWHGAEIDVVIGAGCPHRRMLEDLVAGRPDARLHVQATNMAELFSNADVALCAGGSATWERCCLGLPSIAVAVAENQAPTLDALAKGGYLVYAGRHADVTTLDVARALDQMREPLRLRTLAERSMRLVDGLGVERVLRAIGIEASDG